MARVLTGEALSGDKLGIAPRFAVEVDGMINATFSECSGLVATIRNDKWEEGGANYTTLKFPGRTDFGNITLKHGIGYSSELFDWFMRIMRCENDRKQITVKLVTQDLQEMRAWHFLRAFPVKWTGPTLQTTSNTIAIESIEFAHEGFIKA